MRHRRKGESFLARPAGGGLCSRWQAQHIQRSRGEKQQVRLGRSQMRRLERGAKEELQWREEAGG